MENPTVASGSEEMKDKDATEESRGDVNLGGQGPELMVKDCENTGKTNEENGEDEPNPQAGVTEAGAEITESDPKDSEGEKEAVKYKYLSNSSQNNCIVKEVTINERKKEFKMNEGNAAREEEGRVESDLLKEEMETKIKEKNIMEKGSDSKCLAQETVNEPKAKEKGDAIKEKTKDKQEKTKGKSGATPSCSTPRTSTPTSSRPRSSRPSTRREAMAKFQQDQTPAVRNFKVQKTSVGLSTGASIKQKILHWCCTKTQNYESDMIMVHPVVGWHRAQCSFLPHACRPWDMLWAINDHGAYVPVASSQAVLCWTILSVSIENFSSSWSDGLAFCALVHRFFPTAFDFSTLKASEREKNFTLAFSTAESLAGCCPLLDVSDMLLMGKKPDPFSVFTYVQSLCQHLSKIERERKEKEKAEEGKNKSETEEQNRRQEEEPGEDREQGKSAGEEEKEGEGDPIEEKGETREDGNPKLETDQNDNVVNSEKANEA